MSTDRRLPLFVYLKGRVSERRDSLSMLTPQMTATAQDGPGQSQWPESSPRFPCGYRAQAHEPSAPDFSVTLAESWIGSEAYR